VEILGRVVTVLAAVALGAPGTAAGRSRTIAQGPGGVSTQSPVQLGGTPSGSGSGAGADAELC
jgi:hypothetical protein